MNKQQAIYELFQEAERLQNTADLIRDLIPDDLPNICYVWGTDRNARIRIPYDLSLLRQIRRKLGKGWKLDRSSWTIDHSGRLLAYQHSRGELVITMDANIDGSACRLRQVGVEEMPVYEMPVYDVVCS